MLCACAPGIELSFPRRLVFSTLSSYTAVLKDKSELIMRYVREQPNLRLESRGDIFLASLFSRVRKNRGEKRRLPNRETGDAHDLARSEPMNTM